MWVPAGALFVALGLALFAAWLGESERRAELGEAERVRRLWLAEEAEGGKGV